MEMPLRDGQALMNGKKTTYADMLIIQKAVLAGCAATLESTENLPCKKKKLVNVRGFVKNVDYIPLTGRESSVNIQALHDEHCGQD
jgi:hypothetical protein